MRPILLVAVVVLGLITCLTTEARGQSPMCLDPAEIESVEVLKGPAAVAAFGPKAAAGAITIVMIPKTDARSALTACGPVGKPADDPLGQSFFPPDAVMAHQQAIDLTDRQRSAIMDAMKEASAKSLDIQFKLSGEMEKLVRLLQAPSVNESQALEQVDRVLALEREMKHTQLTLMIRTKNQLTEQQQKALANIQSGRFTRGNIQFKIF
jgi:Spy/CpxP family protein refolding chaperone